MSEKLNGLLRNQQLFKNEVWSVRASPALYTNTKEYNQNGMVCFVDNRTEPPNLHPLFKGSMDKCLAMLREHKKRLKLLKYITNNNIKRSKVIEHEKTNFTLYGRRFTEIV